MNFNRFNNHYYESISKNINKNANTGKIAAKLEILIIVPFVFSRYGIERCIN